MLEKFRKAEEAKKRRLLAEGEAIGIAKGEAIGVAKGEAIGIAKGEAIGVAKGEAMGMAKGRAEIMAEVMARQIAFLRALIAKRFGDVPEAWLQWIAAMPDVKRINSVTLDIAMGISRDELEAQLREAARG